MKASDVTKSREVTYQPSAQLSAEKANWASHLTGCLLWHIVNQQNIINVSETCRQTLLVDYMPQQASREMWGSVGLKVPIHTHFFRRAILTHKVGLDKTNLVFAVQWGFISRSVHARLQVSVCRSYDLCTFYLTQIWMFLHFYSCDFEKLVKLDWMCHLLHPYRLHVRCKFGDCRSVICRNKIMDT